MRIEIVAWSKHQPRNDYKSLPWIKLQTDFYRHKKLHGCSRDTRLLLVDLFCVAGEENKDGVVEGDVKWLTDTLKMTEEQLTASLDELKARGMIEIKPYVSRTSRVRRTNVSRTADVRPTNVSRTLRKITEDNVTEDNVTVYIDPAPPLSTTPVLASSPDPTTPGSHVWQAYREAYTKRYNQEPVRNKMTNSQCKQLVERLGQEGAVRVVQFFLTHQKSFYVTNLHKLGLCVIDAEPLHTQMLAGHRVTNTEALDADKGQSNAQVFERVAAKLRAEREARGEQ